MVKPDTERIRAVSDKWWSLWGRWLVMLLLALLTGLGIPAFRAVRSFDQRLTAEENFTEFVVQPFIAKGDRWTPAMAAAMESRLLLAQAELMSEHIEGGPHGNVSDDINKLTNRLERIESLLLERLPR